MKIERWIASAMLLGAFLWLASGAQAYMETFPTDYAGWTTYTINNTGSLPLGDHALFNSPGGNLGGYIYASVPSGTDTSNTRLYSFEVSGAGFGNLSGQTLTVDYRSTGTINGPSGADVRLYITDGGTNFFISSSLGSPGTGGIWKTLSVLMNAGNFTRVGSGTVDFGAIAASPGEIGLIFGNGNFSSNANLGFSSTDGATISIDNFGTPNVVVPIPAGFWLLGSGLAGLISVRRKIFTAPFGTSASEKAAANC